ncbi:MGDG synthase family glycosyltransferase [Prosthecobacter sp.]|uniref:MGDG synthase family glycosyltransferase n=1 Tax=Prosthecobacter sp. TaxID=1965333 RepID=UPI003784C158
MILILTAGFGDGHNTAARSVAEALKRLCPDEEIEMTDLISEALPLLSDVCKSLYQFAITHWPAGWRMTYDLMGRRSVTGPDAVWQMALVNALKQRIESRRPRLIISTYPLYAILLESLAKQQAVPPLCTVITDSISVNRVWVMSGSDLFCVADEETKKVVTGFGVPEAKIRVSGFPVDLAFTEPLAPQPPVSHARILYLPSTTGRRVAATLEALKPLFRSGVKMTLPVGKHDKRLYHVLRRFTDSMPEGTVEIIGWTKRIPEFLRTHDVVICKAGGAILHEVLAAKIPAVIDYIVPGQEEGNAEMLVKHDGGVVTENAGETAAAVESILINNCAVGRRMRASMAKISMPDAAIRTARVALSVASS